MLSEEQTIEAMKKYGRIIMQSVAETMLSELAKLKHQLSEMSSGAMAAPSEAFGEQSKDFTTGTMEGYLKCLNDISKIMENMKLNVKVEV